MSAGSKPNLIEHSYIIRTYGSDPHRATHTPSHHVIVHHHRTNNPCNLLLRLVRPHHYPLPANHRIVPAMGQVPLAKHIRPRCDRSLPTPHKQSSSPHKRPSPTSMQSQHSRVRGRSSKRHATVRTTKRQSSHERGASVEGRAKQMSDGEEYAGVVR